MLADAFQVTKGTITHSLQVLEKRGFVQLDANPKDGRSKIVRLTEAGRTFRNEAIVSLGPAIEKLTVLLDPGKLKALLPELTQLRATLDANRDV